MGMTGLGNNGDDRAGESGAEPFPAVFSSCRASSSRLSGGDEETVEQVPFRPGACGIDDTKLMPAIPTSIGKPLVLNSLSKLSASPVQLLESTAAAAEYILELVETAVATEKAVRRLL
jgi:hypothetical protein